MSQRSRPDQELIKRLTLLWKQPSFVFREDAEGGLALLAPPSIPANDGFYWVAGTTVPSKGAAIDSVFVIDTDSGAEQHRVFWCHQGEWFERDGLADLLASLNLTREEFFPYSWQYRVAVDYDTHK